MRRPGAGDPARRAGSPRCADRAAGHSRTADRGGHRDADRRDFDAVLRMLSDGIPTGRGRGRAYLYHDRINRRIKARRGARLAAITSGGAIPDTANYTVIAEPDGTVVGSVDEDFAVESLAGDIILLG